MKLSDIKGEKSLDIIADVMELAEKLQDDKRFQELIKAVEAAHGDGNKVFKALCAKAPTIIRDEKYKSSIISVLADINGVSAEEYAKNGNVIGDVFELLTDNQALSFLDGSENNQSLAG